DGDILPVNIKTIDANFTHVADTATQTVSFTDVSTNATSWAWDFGDGSTSTLSDPVHTYAGAGTYPVELRVNKICTYRDTVVLPVVSSLDASVGMPQISLSPNPAQHQIYVRLDRPTQENLELLLFTLDGKILRESSILKGEAQKEFDLGGISTGVYRMQIRGASMIQTLPVMIHPW
ncbi:MAG: PKD domain-containing protein, partial [Bacteroidota bacterium]